MYKVKNIKTGKYCVGSKNAILSFSKEGKVYTKLGHVKSMLKQFYNNEGIKFSHGTDVPIEDLRIIEYEIVENKSYEVKNILKNS